MKPIIQRSLRAYRSSIIAGLVFLMQPILAQTQNTADPQQQRGLLPPDEIIERFDADGNGTLSESEMPPRLAPAFNNLDANRDNQVSQEELAALADNYASGARPGDRQQKGEPLPPEEIIERFDADDNGTLSESEMPPRLAPKFNTLDANGDNQVSAEELVVLQQRRP